VVEVVRRLPDEKNNASATHFFALSPKPMVQFRWKRARLSLFRPQPHLPSFIQIHPSVRDLLAKTTFQIVTIISDPICDLIADNNAILYSGAIWQKLNNDNQHCSITASLAYIAQMEVESTGVVDFELDLFERG